MFRAKNIKIFMPDCEKIEEFKDVEFQSNPEMELLVIFTNEGEHAEVYSGMKYKIIMEGNGAKESYDMAQRAHTMSQEQMKMMLDREEGTENQFYSGIG
ncbi:MAG: hypothetical protein BEU04_01330 [Marine Group III euryarchaeote CG-Bathy1]|uniref:Uncharacterized protein n=1 Tax=Marine Group III euryarchaeote CG-Bathy1 TaxID=1889001 RepID=A0A1J5TK99_9ARCH|nr:MAG: hypothetical protein BEU04_01330 [Marine Group III euryarchaeote CG-Bathy1]